MPDLVPGELLLEYFTDTQLLTWQARAKDIQNYHYLWFFELEGKRASVQQKLISALQTAAPVTVDLSGWGRAVAYKYSLTPLSCVGSLKWVGGRFNYGTDIDEARFTPFPGLYLAEDMETGLREMSGLVREEKRAGLSAQELSLCSACGVSWVAVEGVAHNIFDVRNKKNLEPFAKIISGFRMSGAVKSREQKMRTVPLRLIRNVDELHMALMAENWREHPTLFNTPANSQLLAKMIALAGFEGVLYSSTITGKNNLALFPRQLANSDTVVRVLSPPPSAHCCELNRNTFADAEKTSFI